jgi:hypothetical protein
MLHRLALTAALLVPSTIARADVQPVNPIVLGCGANDGKASFYGGVQLREGWLGALSGTLTDNYVAADLVCRRTRATAGYLCVGLWGAYPEPVPMQVLISAPAADGSLTIDVLDRSPLYGGQPFRFRCTP